MKKALIRINFISIKKTINNDDIDTKKKIVLSSKDSYGNKYFIGYDDYNDGIIQLFTWLSTMNVLDKYFKDRKYANPLVYDKELLKKYSAVWNKNRSLFKKEFDSEPSYTDKYIRTIVNMYNKLFLGKRVSKKLMLCMDFCFITRSFCNCSLM